MKRHLIAIVLGLLLGANAAWCVNTYNTLDTPTISPSYPLIFPLGSVLTEDAINVLAQRNGTNPQTYRVYNTFTDASNYERAVFLWSGNAFSVQTQAAGTGTLRSFYLGTNSGNRWIFTVANNFVAETDNAQDIGGAGANRPRTVYAGTSVIAPLINGAGQYVGTATNDTATAGNIGQLITATAAPGAVSVSTGVSINVTSVSLTAGDWDCSGTVNFTYGATTSVTNLTGGASQTTGTLPSQDSYFDIESAAQVPTGGAVAAYPIPVTRQLLSGPASVFLVT